MNLHLPRLPYREDKLFGCLFMVVLLVPLLFCLFTYENFEIIKYAVLLVFTGAGLVIAFARRQPPPAVRGGKAFFYFLILFWLWALLATLLAWDKNYSFFGFYARFTNGFIFYTVWALLVFLFSLMDWEQIGFLLKTSVAVSTLVALWGLMQSVGLGFYLGLSSDFFSRLAPSFLGNTDFSSMFVVALLPLTVVFFYRSKKIWNKACYAAAGFIQLWALDIFASRGAFIGLAAALLVAVVLILKFSRGKKWLWLSVIIVISLLGIGFGAKFLDFSRPSLVSSSEILNDVNVQYRLNVWRLSVESLGKRPLQGVGLGNFELMFQHDRQAPLIDKGFFDDAHNLLLEIGVTGGLPMLLWFLCLIVAACWAAVRMLFNNPQPEQIGLVAALAAWLGTSLFTPVPIPCYVLLALLLSACFTGKLGTLAVRPVLKTAAIFTGSVLAVWGILFFSAEILFYRGVVDYGNQDYSAGYKLTAAATRLNPFNRLYYVFESGSAIRSGQPAALVNTLLAKTQTINTGWSYGYIELANLNYLYLYQTRNPALIPEVLVNIQTAIRLDPYSAGNYFTLASFQLAFGNVAAAQASVQKGLALDPGYESAEIFLVKTYQLQNNKAAALETLTRTSQADPANLQLLKLWHLLQQAKNISNVPFNVDLGLGQLS